MSYLAERREEERERRRADILVAAESLYAQKGWDAVTMDQVARVSRLSRALLYVYFRDKDDLLLGIGERAMRRLRACFVEASAGAILGVEKIEAIGRAYLNWAQEFPHYFDACARFQARAPSAQAAHGNDGPCRLAGDAAMNEVVSAVRIGLQDGSIRPAVGAPLEVAIVLFAFTHGLIQLLMHKAGDLAHWGVGTDPVIERAFTMLRLGMTAQH